MLLWLIWHVLVSAICKVSFFCGAEVDVAVGTMLISVYYLSLPVYHKTVDLPGPISEGQFTSIFQENFPAYTPPVKASP